MQSWVIGSGADCDVVVGSPLASKHHCRLTRGSAGLVLEDLGSTHGTFVDGQRITAATRITPSQEITIGQTVPIPWPPDLVKFVSIGRVPGNDIVLDDLRVSSRHARLMIVGGTEALIEDLRSSNGTYLNSADARVMRLTPLSISDTVYFGSMAVPAAQLLAGLLTAAPAAVAGRAEWPRDQPPPLPPAVMAGARPPAPQSAASARQNQPVAAQVGPVSAVMLIERNRWVLAALGLAPVLAFLIILVSGRQAGAAITEGNQSSIAQPLVATTFALAVAAAWFGFTLAVAEVAQGSWPTARPEAGLQSSAVAVGSRLGVPVLACALGCAVLLGAVYLGSGLRGPWLGMWGVMVMACASCLLLGLLVSTVLRSWQAVALACGGCLAFLVVLGGWIWPLPRAVPPATWAMNVMPTRWAFEGLLLLESPHHPTMEDPGAGAAVDQDLAEAYFPADSQRMGPLTDLTALGSMLVGLTLALVIAAGTRPG